MFFGEVGGEEWRAEGEEGGRGGRVGWVIGGV